MRKAMIVLALAAPAACMQRPHDEPVALSVPNSALAVEMNTMATLDVLADAMGLQNGHTLAITVPPANGSASFTGDELSFVPLTSYLGSDALQFEVTNEDGATATASVAVTVGCATCATNSPIALSWNPNAASDMVTGYRVYYAMTNDTTALVKVDDLSITTPGFDPNAPGVTYDAWSKFQLRVGDQACFAVTAYNANGESGFSNVACLTVTRGMMHLGVQ